MHRLTTWSCDCRTRWSCLSLCGPPGCTSSRWGTACRTSTLLQATAMMCQSSAIDRMRVHLQGLMPDCSKMIFASTASVDDYYSSGCMPGHCLSVRFAAADCMPSGGLQHARLRVWHAVQPPWAPTTPHRSSISCSSALNVSRLLLGRI